MGVKDELRQITILQLPIQSNIPFEACCKMNVGRSEYIIFICSSIHYYSTCMFYSMHHSGTVKITERVIVSTPVISHPLQINWRAGASSSFFVGGDDLIIDLLCCSCYQYCLYNRSKDCSAIMGPLQNDSKASTPATKAWGDIFGSSNAGSMDFNRLN
jgi:hypothetical protein